jgi:hypothetical protein
MKFVFQTSINSDDETKLNVLQKPIIEFNILEAYISRLRAEFAKHEPNIIARAADGLTAKDFTPEFIQTLHVVEAHLREIFFDASNDSLEYTIFSDLLGGGLSAVQVFTDYINEMSFEQNIRVEKVFDPTLTGFDPLARDSHKGDGGYCFHLIPKTEEEFELEFGKGAADSMKFQRNANVGSFNWSYVNQQQNIVLLADYYCKVRKKERIVKLSNGHSIVKRHYKHFLDMWNQQGFIEQAPVVVDERNTTIETIDRYIICEDKILKEEHTNYKYLPLVFIDGNSVILRQSENGATEQVTRPFVFHAKGVQQLKNYSGQTIASEIENMVQHKWIASAESIPPDYADAYKNPQQASVIVYNQFYKDNPEMPLTPPREVQRTPTPPIVENTFAGTDRTTQVILGTYDSVLGTNDKQISGVAIQQGALQSNAASNPYLISYVKGLNRIGQIIVDLIPKYYVTPRSLPIMQSDGKRKYQLINHKDNPLSIDFMYNPNSLQIKVEAGISAAVQKQVALDQIIRMMQACPDFAGFINQFGLETIIDNLDIRGVEDLKAMSVQYMEGKRKQAEEQAKAGDPAVNAAKMQAETIMKIEGDKTQAAMEKAEGEHAVAAAKVAIDKQNADTKFIEVMSKVESLARQQDIMAQRLDSENARTAVETALDIHKHHHDVRQAESAQEMQQQQMNQPQEPNG